MGQHPNPMTLTLTLLALSLITGFAVLLVNIANAPEGYEDANGFHAKLAGKQAKQVAVRVKASTHQIAA